MMNVPGLKISYKFISHLTINTGPTSLWCVGKLSLFVADYKQHKRALCGQNAELFNSTADDAHSYFAFLTFWRRNYFFNFSTSSI